MKYRVKLLADYHSALWPHGKVDEVKEFTEAEYEQLVSDFGKNKLEVSLVAEFTAEEAKPETAIQKALGKLKR